MGMLPAVIVAALAFLLNGCATPALWEEGRFARYHEPADLPKLQIFRAKDGSDFLVEYDEIRDGSDSLRKRAYWLKPNLERLADRRKPRFVRADQSTGLEPIAIFGPPGPLVPPADADSYAVVSTNGHAFTICAQGKNMDEYELPVYRDASGRVKQLLLTPASVTADVTIAGGVAAWYCLPAFWTSLNCLTH
ncbi:MAG: hypothetical protein QOJ40_2152 [Verrucomicrobiota bacterium]